MFSLANFLEPNIVFIAVVLQSVCLKLVLYDISVLKKRRSESNGGNEDTLTITKDFFTILYYNQEV